MKIGGNFQQFNLLFPILLVVEPLPVHLGQFIVATRNSQFSTTLKEACCKIISCLQVNAFHVVLAYPVKSRRIVVLQQLNVGRKRFLIVLLVVVHLGYTEFILTLRKEYGVLHQIVNPLCPDAVTPLDATVLSCDNSLIIAENSIAVITKHVNRYGIADTAVVQFYLQLTVHTLYRRVPQQGTAVVIAVGYHSAVIGRIELLCHRIALNRRVAACTAGDTQVISYQRLVITPVGYKVCNIVGVFHAPAFIFCDVARCQLHIIFQI